jgi:hypothetical protein
VNTLMNVRGLWRGISWQSKQLSTSQGRLWSMKLVNNDDGYRWVSLRLWRATKEAQSVNRLNWFIHKTWASSPCYIKIEENV